MEFTYENQGASTYLVYQLNDTDELDSLSLGMLTNNKIQGLAQTLFTQMNENRYIKYNVSSKVSMRQFFNGPVNKKRLIGVFSGIVDGLLSAEDYMIDFNSIVLDLDYIFADVSSCEAMLICLPISNLERERTDMGEFFKNIMVNTQFDSTENSDHVAKIFNFLNSSPVFSLTDFKAVLEGIRNEGNVTEMLSDEKRKAVLNQQDAVPNNINNQGMQPQQTPMQRNDNGSTGFNEQVVTPPVYNPAQARQMNNGAISGFNGAVQNQRPNHPEQQFQPTQPMQDVKQMNIPGGNNNINQPGNPAAAQFQMNQQGTEKEMSLFYLLQHYSSKNAAIYKAQKAAKKAQMQNEAALGNQMPNNTFVGNQMPNNASFGNMEMPEGNNKPKKEKKQKKQKEQQQPGNFAVPGQQIINNTTINPNNAWNNITPPQTPAYNQYGVPAGQNTNFNTNYGMQQNPSQMPNQQVFQPQSGQQEQQGMQGQHMDFGETTNLDMLRRGGTTVLNQSMRSPEMVSPNLTRLKTNEKIMINKPVFRIGKEKSYVDYFISDNTAVSRSHANIITRDSKYYVMDTNSTNHTYVNGKMIQSNIEVELNHGDKIRFGNEDFEFMIY